jgi:hypothetical protein
LLKGEGYADLLCSHVPPPSKFECYKWKLLNGLVDVNKVSFGNDVEEHVAAAFDGSWPKRSHASLDGVVTGASLETGKVIDVECLKKYCQGH